MRVCIAHGGDLGEPSGGTDRVTAIASGLAERDIGVTLVVPSPSSELSGRLDSVEVHPVDTDRLSRSNPLGRAVAVARRARRIASDKHATLQFEHSVLAGIGAFRLDREFILDMHDVAYSRFDHLEGHLNSLLKPPVAQIERYAARNAAHIIVVSQFMQDLLVDRWNVAEAQVAVVPNGYFPERVDHLRDVTTVEGRVSFLGTLHPKVDVETLVAIGRMDAVSELYVIGDGAHRDRLDDLENSIPSLIVTGRLPDEEAFEIVASSEVVINPQTTSDLQRSSSPVKLFYYAALGKPMVVTEGPSVASDLADVGGALLANSRAEFVDAIGRILNDETLASELSKNVVAAANEFRWDDRIEEIAAIHRNIR